MQLWSLYTAAGCADTLLRHLAPRPQAAVALFGFTTTVFPFLAIWRELRQKRCCQRLSKSLVQRAAVCHVRWRRGRLRSRSPSFRS